MIRSLILALTLGFGLRAEETESGSNVAALMRKAQAGDLAAQLEVSEHFLINATADTDDAPKRDFKQVEKWLLAATLNGSAPAARLLGELLYHDYPGVPGNRARALAAFQKAAQGGDVQAMLMLAGVLTSGAEGVQPDLAKAEEWMKKAAETAPEGSPECDQANRMLQQFAEWRDADAERAELAKQAGSKDPAVRFELGQRLLAEAGSDKELNAAAVEHLRFAAEAGHAAAQDAYGIYREQSDRAAGFAWRLKAADAGVASAQSHVGLVLLRGTDGIPQDPARGLDYIMRAQAQGETTASRMLSNDGYFPGLGSKEAARLAFSNNPADLAILSAAAERGEVQANYWLGAYYYTRDTRRSTALYEKAAAQGHIGAMKSLASAYAYGLGTPKNQEQAFAWLCRTALLDHREVRLEMAERYFKGEGTPKNPALARYWYERVMDPANANSAEKELAGKQLEQLKAPAAAGSAIGESTLAAASLARLPSTMPAAPVAVASTPAAKPEPAPSATATRTLDEHRAAAEKGDPESMYQLGRADLERRQIESNKQTGPYYPDPQRNATDFRWIMSAARAGHPGAQFLAATHWLSAETDADKQAWLQKAAAQGHAPAVERLAANDKAAVNKVSADAAEAQAAAEDEKLANAADPEAAFRALRRRVVRIAKAITDNFSAGQSSQQLKVGYLDSDMGKWVDTLFNYGHLEGLGLIHNWCQDSYPGPAYLALLLRRDLATLHPGLALKEGAVGLASPGGWKQAYDRQRTKLPPAQIVEVEAQATRIFNKPASITVYGYNFAKGRCGFPQDYDQAVRLYQKAVDAGSPVALYNLASCYWSGLGVPRDQLAAYDLMKKAVALGYKEAEQGVAFAEKDPGFARLHANRQNNADAWDLAHINSELLQRALSGETKAQSAIGTTCLVGKQVPQNYDRAFHWLSLAAEKGEIDALNGLGLMFSQGYGRPVDHAVAYGYFLKAAEKGFAPSQFVVGEYLWEGTGVTKDRLAGHDWIKRAADQGHAPSKEALAKITADVGLQLLLNQRKVDETLKFVHSIVGADPVPTNVPTQAAAPTKPGDRTEEFTAMAASVAEEYRRILALAAARGLPAPGPTPLQQIAQSLLGVNESLARVTTPVAREALLQSRAMAQTGAAAELEVFRAEQLIRAGRTAEAMTALEKLPDEDRVPVLKARLLLKAPDVPRDYSRARALLRQATKSLEPGAALVLGNWFADARNPGRDELVVAAADEPFIKRPGHWPKGADWDAAVWWTVETRWTKQGQPSLHGEAAAQKLAALRLPADAQAALTTLADYHIGKLTAKVARNNAP